MKIVYLICSLIVLAIAISLIRKYFIPKSGNFFVELLVSVFTILILVFVFTYFYRHRK